ncbi:MAG: metallophosphoesterase [Bifidobacterium aquikefiri]|uniref:Serine/threonine protein phosphatase n=1 Tax=Bifidobacterium aquikefiri TaxID=1653207 RepID=A0A261G8P9_9BIFI|nr:metallophosphoesterase [Bifidobacterium aquikefiri]OZG67798.1 serine/threonine protein phosphatase [Bifidobacterium aquikefiri]
MIESRFSGRQATTAVQHSERVPVSISARLGRLQFHHSGKFRVLQLADIQDGPTISPDTVSLIAAACDAARPDLVVLSGNQIAGYDAAYSRTFRKRRWSTAWDGVYAAGRSVSAWVGNALQGVSQQQRNGDGGQNPGNAFADDNVSNSATIPGNFEDDVHKRDIARTRDMVHHSMQQFLAPIVDRGIPFAVTYGNHDFQCGLDTAQMDALYREFPGCLNPESTIAQPEHPRSLAGAGLPDQIAYACEPGTFALPVSDDNGRSNVMGIVLLNSGDYAREGGYGNPSAEGLGFLRQVPRSVGTNSIVFQHIPLPQFYSLLKPVASTTAYAVQGYRSYDRQCYVLDAAKTLPGSYLGEGISCADTDCGEFDILKSSHGYSAVFAGHDHRNGFVGKYEGIMLGATPTCGFGSYGPVPRKRAARMFEFDIRHPDNPRTQLLEFGDLVGKPRSHRAYTFAMSYIPSSTGDAVNLLRKPGFLAGSAATLAAVFASLRKFGHRS